MNDRTKRVLLSVSSRYGSSRHEVLGHARRESDRDTVIAHAEARNVIMYVLNRTGMTYEAIAEELDRHARTVGNGVRWVSIALRNRPQERASLAAARELAAERERIRATKGAP